MVRFVDSTYTNDVEEYEIGDSVYVLASEWVAIDVPKTVNIYVKSGLGDEETIIAYLPDNVDYSLIRPHGGCIKSLGATNVVRNNGILEVDQSGDIITARYYVKSKMAVDTAIINP